MSDSSHSATATASSDSEQEEVEQSPPPSKKARTAATSKAVGASLGTVASTPLEVAPTTDITLSGGGNRQHSHNKPIIVILDQATLETIKNKKGVYELLNCDDHRDYCRKKLRKDPNEFRPDILHQEMLSLLDSPLNKAGFLKVFIQTKRRVLIDVNPSLRIPRTYKRFAGLMVQLLHKMKIKAGTESTTLLKVIKNPVSQYLPAGTRCYGFSCEGQLYSPVTFARAVLPDEPSSRQPPTCFVVGAMSTGHVQLQDHPYMEKMVSISEYPLSGAAAISRLVAGIEHHWGIV